MSKHRGYTVCRSRDRWAGRFRVDGTYQSKVFDSKSAAEDWARKHAAAAELGARFDVAKGPKKKTARTKELGTDYIRTLDGRRRGLSHLEYLKRVFAGLEAVAPDLADDDAPEAIRRWLDALKTGRGNKTQPAKPATRNKFLVVIRGMCRWAISQDLLVKDPTRAIGMASVPDKLKPQFSVDELRHGVAHTHFKTQRGMRKDTPPKPDPYHLLFCVLAYSGLRFQEATHLRWEDFDWGGPVILVRLESGGKIKRNRERVVPIQPELRAILEPIKQRDGHLFNGREHNPRRGFQAFLQRAGVAPNGRTPHSLRHTYAGIMAATGVPPHLLMAYLGHSNASTMMGYTKLAARYAAAVGDWKRGEMKFLLGTS